MVARRRYPGRCCGLAAAAWLVVAGWNGIACRVASAQTQASAVPAADPAIGLDRVRFETIGMANGLSQSTVNAVAQDRDGFLWVATQDGLNRFDGYRFRTYRYDRTDRYSLGGDYVEDLRYDRHGRLWVATSTGGVSRYDPVLDRFDNFALQGPDQAAGTLPVYALHEGIDGTIWAGVNNVGLFRYDESAQAFRLSGCHGHPRLQHPRFVANLGTGNGLLVGGRVGIVRCGEDGKVYPWGAPFTDHFQISRLAVGPDGDVWVATINSGLHRFARDGTVRETFHRDAPDEGHRIPDDAVRALWFDRRGVLWIGTDNSGLLRLVPGARIPERYSHDAARLGSLGSNRVASIYEDRHGVIWVGTWATGLSRHDPRTENVANLVGGVAPRGLPAGGVVSSYADPNGTLWFGVLENGGLINFDLTKGVLSRHVHDPARPDSLSDNFVSSVLRTRDGTLWVASWRGGLNRWLGGDRFERFLHDPDDPHSLASNQIRKLVETADGTLWIGTRGGSLDALCAGCRQFRHYRSDPADPTSLGANEVSTMLESRLGEFWLVLRSAGVARLDRSTGRFEHFRASADRDDTISSDAALSLLEDRRGDIWVGTDKGLNRVIRGKDGAITFAVAADSQRLQDDNVDAIEEDVNGRLWLAVGTGLSRFDPQSGEVLNFGSREGMFPTGYYIGGTTRTAYGIMVFGGAAGANVFDPTRLEAAPAPQPLLTDVLIYNRSMAPAWRQPDSPLTQTVWTGGQLTLNHRQGMLTVAFSAPEANDPSRVRYSFRLDPLDSNWIETAVAAHNATYTHLVPGNYVLRVRARNQGADWGPKEAQVKIAVSPPPWLSWPAKTLYALTMASLGALVGWQVRGQQRRKALVQEAIRQSEARLKLVLWGSGGELWDVDLLRGGVRRENPLPRLPPEHIAGHFTLRDFRCLVHPDDRAVVRALLSRHLRGHSENFEASFRLRDRYGDWCWLMAHARVAARDVDGRALRLAGTLHDISPLKAAEAALLEMNEALEARVEHRTAELRDALRNLTTAQRQLVEAEKYASLGGLVAGIAHEINTPVGVSVTAASHLQEELRVLFGRTGQGPVQTGMLTRFRETANASCDIILRNLQRADELVKSFKRVAVDQTTEARRTVDLATTLHEVLIMLGPTLKKTPHKVDLECPSGLVCDTAPGALYQIISNLVMNSLTHGFVPDTPGQVRIVVTREGEHIVLDYADNGVGMSDNVRARVFEPFFTTRRGEGGSGLGMHIVHNLVTQLLQGDIVCHSPLGQGVRFRIRFRARERQAG
ncbi:two-component regulator propeller domain-containing protein [Tahibacter amnicola]|uniref:histidine kinase n=1 Tax=Tahibacter amnicola TaxID=2976241 RepID=A0ABY6BDY9_9GAMM|nr:two-component regulator propeller domain-containing protein [Tahibacter amnicola]UXI66836.1 ATP-binding protein [Tahibacter amnicola]